MLALKKLHVDIFHDVHFRYHLVYERENLTSDPRFKRSSTDGQFDGPGVVGVPAEQLEMALQTLPLSRDGVDAWLAEGCMSWVPLSQPIWGAVTRDAIEVEMKHAEFDIGANV